jgi:hypothetical protein
MMFHILHRNEQQKGAIAAVEFEGGPYDADVSFFVGDLEPGQGPGMHKHPYSETCIVHSGQVEATIDGLTKNTIQGYKYDAALKLPYQDNLSALIHEPSFKQVAGEAVFSKARVINTLGNRAVHAHRAIPVDDALVAVR